MKIRFVVLLAGLTVAMLCQAQGGPRRMPFQATTSLETLPTQQHVLEAAELVNGYFMSQYPDVAADSYVRGRQRPSHIWTRGVYYEGLMALHAIYPREDYLKYALDWAESHQFGLHRGTTTRNADNQCAGQTYLELYNIYGEAAMKKDISICMDMLVNTPQNGDWTWIDAIQMGMPILGQMGTLKNDSRYWEKAHDMYMATRNEIGGGLWNAKDGLWWRDATFCPPATTPNGKQCYWARGNGWVFAALCRYMDRTPSTETYRNQYVKDFKAMAKAIVLRQREDGYWNVSLDDPEDFGGKEVTGTSLFVSGLAWGVRNGLLKAEDYMPAIIKGWKAIEEAIHPENGFLGYIQGTGKEPKDSQPVAYDTVPDFEDFAYGCYLLAATEVYKLAK